MPALVLLGDSNTHGGKVITASSTLFIEGIQVALVNDLVSCPFHGVNRIIEGDATAMDNGVPIVVDNCLCECGCKVKSSSPENSIES
ncbi:PAAR domain-containing protein [Kalamiella sp. sgz302252]|uniref:PAAR domain-containing protein n=1 Tax=Pantoea sp. sgz302252 TaxID=3341827 RepID=UPI0036D28050